MNRYSSTIILLAQFSALSQWVMPGAWADALPGGTLDPTSIPKYETPLFIPPAMPLTRRIPRQGPDIDYYEIAVRQFPQQILPTKGADSSGTASFPATTVWGYGSVNHPDSFHYPAFTVEAKNNTPVRVNWINDLKNPVTGRFHRHLLAVDQTLHWANPPGGVKGRDEHGHSVSEYWGPVPFITHLHGAHANDDSDGYPEAWYLPDASNLPTGFATEGSFYNLFKTQFRNRTGVNWQPGTAVFQYANDQRATTLWYHDHTLGMTRVNIYAGPVGFYLIRGGPDDLPAGKLPKPAPARGDQPGIRYHEIPLVVQDRSFNDDGSLFYPRRRTFFDGFTGPFFPQSDIPPIWNPEVFLNTIVVNGNTWPFLNVEPRRYRFRFLNACNARFLILKLTSNPLADRPAPSARPFWQIGADGGFLSSPARLTRLLIAPAERADVIVDFTGAQNGAEFYLINEGPDEPFGGGEPGQEFEASDVETTGQVMKFIVRPVPMSPPDNSVPPSLLALPQLNPLGDPGHTRRVSLNELSSDQVCANEQGEVVDCSDPGAEPFGPRQALLGIVANGEAVPKEWAEPITERPLLDRVEVWEIHNFTEDAHAIHLHLVQFQVVNRQPFGLGVHRPEAWESGLKDTVIAYPGQITRIKARFDMLGRYTWHCHMLEHEDNEMMRPYVIHR